ncbi:hypothetical protein L6164_010954 [Bauhinia variegata]|uniref:Uncharacterized protein n=1 Tax=Bauhinia variegata TaxID=167791 RepID=A0ACB9P562_BAUVA|nr:hypothetical protein L6164_010954 [Bauhinia variegata]
MSSNPSEASSLVQKIQTFRVLKKLQIKPRFPGSSRRYAVAKFRSDAIYAEFMKQWNIGVYFSLRFQEIAGALDSVLTTSSLNPVQNSETDVLVLSCSDKFLRLSLQLLSRYSNWLSSGLTARKKGNTNTNTNAGCEWAISALTDDLVFIIHDIKCLEEQSILQGGQLFEDLQRSVIKAVVDSLVEKSVEDLRQMKGITATYRMTNKPLPVRHSPYVSGILRPLKGFLDGERATTYLASETRNKILLGAATEITDRYYEIAADIVSLARKKESSLQEFRQSAQKPAGLSSDVSDNNVSNTDKICMQLFLDIQEYARDLSALGVDAVTSRCWFNWTDALSYYVPPFLKPRSSSARMSVSPSDNLSNWCVHEC